jgi:DNA repair protein RadC
MVAEKTNRQLLNELIYDEEKVECILNHYAHNISLLARCSVEDLINLGLSRKKSSKIVSALELFKRIYTDTSVKMISNSADAFQFFKHLGFSNTEIFGVLFLDRGNNVIAYKDLFAGGICETTVDIRVVLKQAILYNCTGMIIGHNHPSTTRIPSQSDIILNKEIKEATKMVQIQLLDNLIITKNSYISFQDTGIF